ncbi:MAG: alpha/beta hydrolase [Candidatus Hydrogenedentes bacterium]|nr:alpha/beta hydrolase [Candidatus Hydrogenedentota bacterium]
MKLKKSFLTISKKIKLAIYNCEARGEPIIFCHFTGGMGQLWIPVIERIIPNFNCFAYDARGHGNSSKPRESSLYLWDYHLKDLILILMEIKENTKRNEIYGVGHSFGGALLSQAVLHTKHLLNWKGIILIEPIIAPQTFDLKKDIMANIAKRRKGLFDSVDSLQKTLKNKKPYKNWSTEAWQIFEKYGFWKDRLGRIKIKCTPEIESYQYLHANPPGWFENLKKLHLPVLLIYGRESELLPLAEYQMMQLKTSGYLVKLPNIHHFLPQENPYLASQWILRWFS